MIKKLATVRKQVGKWNDVFSFDKERSQDTIREKLRKQSTRVEELRKGVKRLKRMDKNMNGQEKKASSFVENYDSEELDSKNGNFNKFAKRKKFDMETVPEDKITPRRRGGHMIQKFNFEQFEENNKMQMQTFLEEKMLDEEILLKSLRKEKLNYPLQLMLWIRSNMTNEVLVKVDQEVLDGIKL